MLAHGGGFTPYQAARWEHGWKVRPEPKKNVSTQPKNIAKRFMYDTILHSDKTLEAMIGLVGSDHVLLGSDYPYDMGTGECVRQVKALSIAEADKAKVLCDNARALLGVS
jgi:aminocarboxymuconate-semialdehyde decarboxylase